MPPDTTKTEANDAASNGATSVPNQQPAQPNAPAPPVAPETAQAEPRVPQPGAAGNSAAQPRRKPSALSALPPLPSPIYAAIPPRFPTPLPSIPQKPLPPLEQTASSPSKPLPKKESIVFAQPKVEAPAGQELADLDVGLPGNIVQILHDAQMPERRETEAATETPSLQETPLTDAPYRSTVQLDPASPETDVPSAIELALAQNKLAMPKELNDQPLIRGTVVSLHTMKSDLQSAAIDKKLSVVRAASMEADRRASEGKAPNMQPNKKAGGFRSALFLVVTILMLLGLGGAALYAVYYLKVRPITVGQVGIGILFAEQQLALPLDGQGSTNLKQGILQVMRQNGTSGSIVEIVPTTQENNPETPVRPATTGEFLRALGTYPTDEFVRSLSEQFFFGIHFADSPSPVFVIPVTSYNTAFAGMLAWEKSINTDLAGLFKKLPQYRASTVAALMASTTAPVATSTPGGQATTTATSTPIKQTATTSVSASTTPTIATPAPTMNELAPPRTFEDLVMKNYDVRALKDDNDQIVLYYSFPTQNILIISASPYSFPEVLSRLQAARKL